MSNQKDMRREELSKRPRPKGPALDERTRSPEPKLTISAVVPYVAPPGKESETELSGTLASILPMAAVGVLSLRRRNKLRGTFADDTPRCSPGASEHNLRSTRELACGLSLSESESLLHQGRGVVSFSGDLARRRPRPTADLGPPCGSPCSIGSARHRARTKRQVNRRTLPWRCRVCRFMRPFVLPRAASIALTVDASFFQCCLWLW